MTPSGLAQISILDVLQGSGAALPELLKPEKCYKLQKSGYAAQLLVSELDFLPDGNYACERVCWIKLAKEEELRIEGQGDDAAVQGTQAIGVKVKDVVKVAEKRVAGFRFSDKGTGCRRWVLEVLDALVATGFMMDGKNVDVVREHIRNCGRMEYIWIRITRASRQRLKKSGGLKV
ncbi:hypothetical protein K504DRAFT_507626 [Pleomassaria siparia CBS 279.74]|uniref:DUF7770 domain-containing protein n=1 Tax=Pleomassaria siparia CBS 279.74 TaxID=1314801 RepID=A0A6G1JTY8_9PLEO|nr:hypothetical protein K504DRAFT_507626 [Pleomassaria siparia CBS 279.74]